MSSNRKGRPPIKATLLDREAITATDEARFWTYVEKSEGCWNWKLRANRYGYGQHAGTWREHFDIALSKRALAVQHGAIEVTQREFVIFAALSLGLL